MDTYLYFIVYRLRLRPIFRDPNSLSVASYIPEKEYFLNDGP